MKCQQEALFSLYLDTPVSMRKMYMPITLLLFTLFVVNLKAQDSTAVKDTGTLTAYHFAANDAGNPCITPQQYMAM
jgi:hypothetical protein